MNLDHAVLIALCLAVVGILGIIIDDFIQSRKTK